MSVKVMCAGCSAEERERAESDVRRALGARAAGSETWIVSVINLQSRWSVTLDGPGIRALNCTAPPGRLVEAIQEALQARIGAPPAAAAPASRAAPPATAAPAVPVPRPGAHAAGREAAAPVASRPAPAPATATPARPGVPIAGREPDVRLAGRAAAVPARAPAPAAAAPLPRPAPPVAHAGNSATPASRPAVSAASGPRRVGHECIQCHQRFAVTFDAIAGEPEHMTPVACPHCWHMNQVMVGETAADTSDFRAEKA